VAEESRLWCLTGNILRVLPAAWARHPSLLEMAEEKRKYPDARTIVDDLFEFAGVGLLDCLVGIHPPPLGVPAGNRTRGSLLEGVRYAVAYKKLVDDKVIPDDDPSHTIAHFYGEDPTRLGRWEKEHDPGPCYERLKNAVITHPPEFRKVAAILVIARPAKVFKNRRHRGARKREGVRV